jgi:hypothetical protein
MLKVNIRKLLRLKIILTLCALGILFIIGAILNSQYGFTNFLYYNKNIDLNKKTGYILKQTELYGKTLYDQIDMCDAIIKGEVISEGVGFEDIWSVPISESEQHTYTYPLTSTKIRIDEVLYGQIDKEIVNFIQIGSPNMDDGEVKVKLGQKVIILLHSHGNGEDYSSVSVENGIFYIEGFILYTFSPLSDLNKYEGCNPQILLTDINRIATFNRLSPENNFFKRIEQNMD